MNKINLRVEGALRQDVGSGRARIDEITREHLEVTPGDIVKIRGNKKTGAVVWRAKPPDRGKDIIRLDSYTRENADVDLGGNVIVERIEPPEAKQVTLAINESISYEDLKKQINGDIEHPFQIGLLKRPLSVGDTVVIPGLLFNKSVPFLVCETVPKDIVVVGENTHVEVMREPIESLFRYHNKEMVKNLEEIIEQYGEILDESAIAAIKKSTDCYRIFPSIRKDSKELQRHISSIQQYI